MGLAAHSFLYESLLRDLQRRQKRADPSLLAFVEKTAWAAYHAHSGRFADGALENVALRMGMQLTDSDLVLPAAKNGDRGTKSRTLHVVSEVAPTGGHSRILTKWIQRDLSSSHAIVITRQKDRLPEFLQRIWVEREAVVTLLNPNDSLSDRARRLRSISTGFDRVILHQHPDDSVPVLAYAKPGGCPVVMFNHAHFWFSMGSTVSDLIVNTMPYFQGVTQRHRFPRATALLSGWPGLEPLRWGDIDKNAAKERLGLPANQPVVLTIATAHYFKPMAGYDFFKTAAKLLDRKRELHLLVVGVPADSLLVPEKLKQNQRLHLLGPVVDPRPYYEAADVSLESFPMSSMGGFCETVAYGEAFPVQTYGPGENILRLNQRIFDQHSRRAETEEEYLTDICALLESKSSTREKAAMIRKVIIGEDALFGDQFSSLYRQIDALKHTPGEIPATDCCDEEDNRLLALLDPQPIGRVLEQLLPLRPALVAHAQAVARGHEPVHEAVGRIGRRFLRSVFTKPVSVY